MVEKSPDRVLGLLAKWPTPGLVKSRLGRETSQEWAADVAMAFLADMVARLSGIHARRILVFTPIEARSSFSKLTGDRFQLIPQSDGDLGRRMAAFFQEVFHQGPAKAILLGVDSPTIPLSYIEDAFSRLDGADLVIGPATDGGYYLFGSSGKVPPIFGDMNWSRSSVLTETIFRLNASSCRLALLPPWYDVDTLNDWRMLTGHLLALRRAGIDPKVPNTEKLAMESPW